MLPSAACPVGLSGSAAKGEWKLRIKENGNGEDNIYSCLNQHDAKKMEKRISKYAPRRQPGEQQPPGGGGGGGEGGGGFPMGYTGWLKLLLIDLRYLFDIPSF